MIFLWREIDEETCSKKNPYEEEYDKAFDEFYHKYGLFGSKFQTEKENQKGGRTRIHFMSDLPEYQEISAKYEKEEKLLNEYRCSCKDEAMDMLKKYFYDLWD